MCSVVEIKNLDEYCIRYHSPESLENLDHLVKERTKVININLEEVEEEENESEVHPFFRRNDPSESLISALEINLDSKQLSQAEPEISSGKPDVRENQEIDQSHNNVIEEKKGLDYTVEDKQPWSGKRQENGEEGGKEGREGGQREVERRHSGEEREGKDEEGEGRKAVVVKEDSKLGDEEQPINAEEFKTEENNNLKNKDKNDQKVEDEEVEEKNGEEEQRRVGKDECERKDKEKEEKNNYSGYTIPPGRSEISSEEKEKEPPRKELGDTVRTISPGPRNMQKVSSSPVKPARSNLGLLSRSLKPENEQSDKLLNLEQKLIKYSISETKYKYKARKVENPTKNIINLNRPTPPSKTARTQTNINNNLYHDDSFPSGDVNPENSISSTQSYPGSIKSRSIVLKDSSTSPYSSDGEEEEGLNTRTGINSGNKSFHLEGI